MSKKGKGVSNLQSNTYKPSYDSYEDLPVEQFYIPSLQESIIYNRAVGYFSSAILAVLSEAFTNFAERGGKINLICSPILTAGDADVLENLNHREIFQELNQVLDDLDNDGLVDPPLNLMAALIRSGCLTIKFAIPYDGSAGIFHQKIGIFADEIGNRIAFKGSNNESLSGWMEMKNSEGFSVYRSWRDDNDRERVFEEVRRFEKMWENQYRGFDIVEYSSRLNFIERRSTEDFNLAELKIKALDWYKSKFKEKHGKSDDWLRPYQREVINNWVKNDFQGVVSFATGAGKTITAIAAIKRWREEFDKRVAIILVPSVRLQKQWLSEIKKIDGFNGVDITLVGGIGKNEHWNKSLRDATANKRHTEDGIVIAVNDTARTPAFYERVQWGGHVLLIADEMHKLGAPSHRDFLDSATTGAVLGLSATPQRFNDDENDFLREFFGEELKPVIDISAAQDMGVLVPYTYFYETVQLTEDEKEEYDELTRKIGPAIGKDTDNGYLTVLLAKRAKVLKSASAKVPVAERIIRTQYIEGDFWVVFCDDKDQLDLIKNCITDLHPLSIYSGMPGSEDETIKLYESRGGILLTIHMFDEGIDIPAIDHALIVASSQSRREFIQRRGRVLRVNKLSAKGLAEIWDLVVVDEHGHAFKESELERAIEFSRTAFNRSIQRSLEKLIP